MRKTTKAWKMANACKTAIVTGASQGTRAGIVEAFPKRSSSVVASSRSIIFARAGKARLPDEARVNAPVDPQEVIFVSL